MEIGEKMKRGIARAFSLISSLLTVFLALILAVNLWLILSRVWLKEPIPSVLSFTPIYVLSGSMEPIFSTGDLILIHPSPAYEPGDVVTFQEEGELITHRIIAETKEGFWVQGDANNVRDEKPVKSDAVIGKVVLILPGVGRAAIFFRSPRGIMILASIVLVTAILTCRRREEEERWKQ